MSDQKPSWARQPDHQWLRRTPELESFLSDNAGFKRRDVRRKVNRARRSLGVKSHVVKLFLTIGSFEHFIVNWIFTGVVGISILIVSTTSDHAIRNEDGKLAYMTQLLEKIEKQNEQGLKLKRERLATEQERLATEKSRTTT